MKNSVRTYSITAAVGLSLLAIAALIMLLKHTDVFTPPAKTTHSIDARHAADDNQPATNETVTSEKHDTTARPSTVTSARPSTDVPVRNMSLSPKQEEIEQSIPTQYAYHALATPDDPYYTNPTYSWIHARTRTPQAWDTTIGTQSVIAIIDTGFALQHEDLASQWYHHPGENGMTQQGERCWNGSPQDKKTNMCDDDGNGYVDDWRGWNFNGRYTPTSTPCDMNGLGSYVTNNTPQAGASGDDILYREHETCHGIDSGDPFESVAHGTSVAGLAGAATNNGRGIATANWNVKIMPLQVLGDDGSGWTGSIVSAIRYAVDNGADVISMSLGGDDRDTALENAINYAYANNVTVIAAAGNCGTGTESGCDPASPGKMGYPALYNHVISVGASTTSDTRADFSSYGLALDVLAPGAGLIPTPTIRRPIDPATSSPSEDQTTFNYTTQYAAPIYGTSFAAPTVASIVSLITSVKPHLTVDEVTSLVDGAARKVGAMGSSPYTLEYGHGVIDAASITGIARALNTSSGVPVLTQAGSSASEHTIAVHEQISSGCTIVENEYCTLRITHQTTGADRYLPFLKAGTSGQTAWLWPSSMTDSGLWHVRAVSGGRQSDPYLLFRK